MLPTKMRLRVVSAIKIASVFCGVLLLAVLNKFEWANHILEIFYWNGKVALVVFLFSLGLLAAAFIISKLARRGKPILLIYFSFAWLVNLAIVLLFPGGIALYVFVTVPLVFFATAFSFVNYYYSFKDVPTEA